MTIEEAKVEIGKILDSVDGTPQKAVKAECGDSFNGTYCADEDCDKCTYDEWRKEQDEAEAKRLNSIDLSTSEFMVGDILVPEDIDELPALSVSATQFRAPSTIDNRDYCLKPMNQGRNPWCAAYTAKMFCEVVKWMERDYPDQNVISAETIYRYAKSIDGCPNAEGTSLVAVLQCLLDKGIFDKEKCRIQVIRKNGMSREAVKYAIHKFGTLPSAFNCTSEWFGLNRNKTCITGNGNYRICGGHAVLLNYYDRNGVGFCNSWGDGYGMWGHGMMTWEVFDQQFLYAACLTNVFDGLKLNV